MNISQLYDIAKLIDNEYIYKMGTFKATRKNDYWYLTTDVCDNSSFIKIWELNNNIESIKVLGSYTDGWQEIQPATWVKISKYIESLNK